MPSKANMIEQLAMLTRDTLRCSDYRKAAVLMYSALDSTSRSRTVQNSNGN